MLAMPYLVLLAFFTATLTVRTITSSNTNIAIYLPPILDRSPPSIQNALLGVEDGSIALCNTHLCRVLVLS